MGEMGFERKKKDVELNSEIWEKGVCGIWGKGGWKWGNTSRELRRIKCGSYGEKGVRHMGERALEWGNS